MVPLRQLVEYTDGYLRVDAFDDYCPNGLQVEGAAEVRRLVSGVTASQALIDAAVEQGADALLVHHGFFWRGEDPRVIGIKARRLYRLLDAGVSLLAYHLPLDAHPEVGNNVGLGKALAITPSGRFGRGELGLEGVLESAVTPASLGHRIAAATGRTPLHIPAGPAAIRRIGWCTGAAQGMLEAAADQGLDAFISGEISESTVHLARERGIHYFSAGHHATERYGARALGEHLASQFGLAHDFIEVENPV